MSLKTKYGAIWVLIVVLACGVGAAPLAPNSGSLSGNLSLWLRMPEINYDPGTGIWTDLSPKGNDAAVVDGFVGPTLSTGENATVFAQPFSAVHFDPAANDLLKAANLNSGSGLTDLTIFHIIKVVTTGGVDQRGVGFGSYQDAGTANAFNPSFDMTLRKNNGSIAGKNQDLPLDQYVIYAARMNSSNIDMWLNTTGTLELAFTSSGTSFATGMDLFYVGDMRYTPAGDFDIAEVVVYNSALTDAQVEGVCQWLQAYVGRVAQISASAATPSPAATDVSRDTTLSWDPVPTAVQRNVYFGSSFEDVNTATAPIASGLTATSLDPGRLDFGQTYYWRVDEVNGTPDNTVFKGDIWNFTVEPYSIQIPVDVNHATASSFTDMNPPSMTVNGSGLNGNTHSSDSDDMWLSAATDLSPWLMYEFDRVQKLDKIVIWNSNGTSEGFIGWGIKDISIESSVDGVDWTIITESSQISRAPGLADYDEPQAVDLGLALAKYVRINILSNWGGLLKQYGVSEVQFYGLPVQARTPLPASGSVDVLPDSVMTWRAGREASQHTVYTSVDADAVANGSAPSVPSNTNSVSLDAFGVQLGETYYWRVDEVNEAEAVSPWEGPVWSLNTAQFLVVDDFESYGNLSPNRPFQTWLDGFGYSADEFFPVTYAGNGTGAGIGHDIWSPSSPNFNGKIMETTNTMAGSGQAMPFYYSNTGGIASQTQRSFATPQDWTVGGAKTLSIAFSGQAGNTGTLYVKINDTKVTYAGDPANLAVGVWQAWNIDLSSMNVQNVTTLQIGVEGSGAAGMLLIDDIRLYPTAGQKIVPVDPGSANLVGAWSFDEGSGTMAADSSGHGHTGTIVDATWDTGKLGSALMFSETGYVATGFAGVTGTGPRTSSAWIKTLQADRTFVSWGLNTVGKKWRIRLDVTGGLRVEINGAYHYGQTYLADDEWHHTAVVLPDDGTPNCSETLLYVDGLPETAAAITSTAVDTDPTGEFRIGMATYDTVGFIGLIDDVRLYDRALSDGEVLSLAGRTTPVDKPF